MNHRQTWLAIGTLACNVALGHESAAQVGAASERPSAARERRWYGWQVMGADVLAGALIGVGYTTTNHGVSLGGVALYVLGGPGLHVAHSNRVAGAVSLGLRLLPFAAGYGVYAIGYSACSGEGKERCRDTSAYAGISIAGVGIATALIVDYVAFSWDSVPRPLTSWSPTVLPTKDGVALGLAGTF